LWHALPESHEEMPPAFYHYPSTDIPEVEIDGIAVRVLIGSAYGVTSPVVTFAETLYLEATLAPGESLALPSIQEAALYVVDGEVSVDGTLLQQYRMMTLENCGGTAVTATTQKTQDTPATRIALIGGEPLGERHIFWNFVSSRKERLEQAKRDWREGRFAKVHGDAVEFIPLPD
ncbi:pirin-like C-terminal cupin domain-containing protein, partial [Nitrosomonas sp.]|uniref:pirin family protein n=1 Tax=Nitrosomonas sp. TaxID=42353 RepID=UPI001D1BAD8E